MPAALLMKPLALHTVPVSMIVQTTLSPLSVDQMAKPMTMSASYNSTAVSGREELQLNTMENV